MFTDTYSFGNQNEIYDSGKNMGKLIGDPVLAEVHAKIPIKFNRRLIVI